MNDKTYVSLYHEQSPDETWTLTEFIEWLQALFASVPAEHRESVQVSFSTEGGYGGDSSYTEVKIGYWRDKTAEELAEEQARADRYRREEEARDRQRLAQLLAKYGH